MLTDMMNPGIYSHPEKFDGFRFLKLSSHDRERKWHLASTSMEHVGFGHGYYSCPGRWFVSDVLKMMLTQFISHYDWDYVQEQPGNLESVHRESPDPNARISFRIRPDTRD
jgi:cytochrome P450